MLTLTEKTDLLRRLPSGPQHRIVEWTPEQIADFERRVAMELAGKEENIAYVRRLKEAAREKGFSGDLRRAIAASQKPPQDLGTELGLDGELIDQFCTGEAALSTDVIDRLVDHLGLQLMQVIR
jgi:hypothetical protein